MNLRDFSSTFTKEEVPQIAREKDVRLNHPRFYWTDKLNQRAFFEQLARTLDIKSPRELGRVGIETIRAHGGVSLLKIYGNSLKEALKSIFPEWKSEWFQTGIWTEKGIQRDFFDTLAKMLNITCPEDWGKVNTKTVIEHGGSSILKLHRNSLIETLFYVYDDVKWDIDWFYKSRGYWEKKSNQRKYLEKLAKSLKISKSSDWGKITISRISEHGGGYLLKLYDKSVLKLLKGIYPEMEWKKEWFVHTPVYPKQYWDSMENQRNFLHQIRKEYSFHSPSDWRRVSLSLFTKHGGKGLLQKYNGSIIAALEANFSHLEFEKSVPFFFPKLVQGKLFNSLHRIVK